MYPGIKRAFQVLALIFCAWAGVQYVLPVIFPFLLGAGLALAAEPGVKFLKEKLRLPRAVGAAFCVSVVFLAIAAGLVCLLALLVREAGALSGILPVMVEAARAGIQALESWLSALAERAPESLRPTLESGVEAFFSGGAALLSRGAEYLLGLAGGILRHVPDSALGLGTAVISGYMISARLPSLKKRFASILSREKLRRLRDSAKKVKDACLGWLLAQVKLAGMTLIILTAGFMLLRISYAPLWAMAVTLVDAFPVLGTGTVLLPWSLVCLIQGDGGRAVGLLGLYAVAALTRSALEPRLVGQHLGLDPLTTLLALYAGYRFWGLPGMLLSPLLAVTLRSLLPRPE